MKKIILFTGGQRSGKSARAENLALSLSDSPVYMATAHIWDEQFRRRVEIHQARRGPQWSNVEEEFELSQYDVNGRVVLIDCCTLWATNFYYAGSKYYYSGDHEGRDVREVYNDLKEEFDRFTSQDATFIFVTNEIGLGGLSSNPTERSFTDLLGMFNQYVASRADEVYFMVSGIEMKIKG